MNPIPEQPIFTPANENEVKAIIYDLKNSSSTGWDNIPTNIIKEISGVIVAPLTQLINKSLQQGVFPDALKIAKISPIYKSKSKTDVKNYRPISVLPVLSKVFEKVFYSRLYAHFVSRNLLSQNQYGFQAGKNTEHALLKFTGDIIDGFDRGKVTVATFMDLSKAFDCVNHEILLAKLEHYGLNSIDKNWVKSYLLDRKHLVTWNKKLSTISTLNIGVPQGSILGPLLFLIYINDIVNTSDSVSFVLFADDTTVYSTGDNLDDSIANMNNQLINISNWFTSNKLTLNVDKTQVMMFSRRTTPIPNTHVELRGQAIANVSKAKFLGVIVDEKLNWKDHVSFVASKLSKSCGILYKVRNCLTTSAKNMLYYSLIHPFLTYCINVYASTYKTNLRPIFLSQKRVIRTLSHASRRDHTLPLFCQWNILPMSHIINFSAALFAYKVLNNLTYSENDFLTRNNPVHNLRNRMDLHIHYNSSTQTQLFIKYRAAKAWNSIPIEIRSSGSLVTFKRKLKLHLFELVRSEISGQY